MRWYWSKTLHEPPLEVTLLRQLTQMTVKTRSSLDNKTSLSLEKKTPEIHLAITKKFSVKMEYPRKIKYHRVREVEEVEEEEEEGIQRQELQIKWETKSRSGG